jgi:hypothetical protein
MIQNIRLVIAPTGRNTPRCVINSGPIIIKNHGHQKGKIDHGLNMKLERLIPRIIFLILYSPIVLIDQSRQSNKKGIY